ncbi:MAG: hypothetical protein IPP74_12300 [Alphaproteobacteria bacterium]|nr:hypothetical protein [Alphaproteobacteria bacterium]
MFVAADGVKIGYGYFVDDDGIVKEGFIDLASDSAALAIPFLPAGMSRGARFLGKTDDIANTAKDIKKTEIIKDLPNDTLVCRGGRCTEDTFINGSGVSVDEYGNLHGVSVNSSPGKSLAELSETIPHKQVGVTSVGKIKEAGGTIVLSPTKNNPNHATLSGISPKAAESLMTPTIKNPKY